MDGIRAGRVLIPAREIEIRFSRSSGPGGQNVNKRATRAEVVFDVAGSEVLTGAQKRRASERLGRRLDARGRLRVVSGSARTQAENRAIALRRLGATLADALKPPPRARTPTKPSGGARERRLASKRARARTKQHRRRPSVDDD